MKRKKAKLKTFIVTEIASYLVEAENEDIAREVFRRGETKDFEYHEQEQDGLLVEEVKE